MEQPNILLIVTDTQRCDTLKCMGNPHAISPNIDRLAAEGVLFENAYTSSPVCEPARCSLLTGVHTPVHGMIENGQDRYTHLKTLPDILKEQGYKNIMTGKQHFGQLPESFNIVYDSNDYEEYLKNVCIDKSQSRKFPVEIPEQHMYDRFYVNKTIEAIDQIQKKGSGPFFAFCSLYLPHSPLTPPDKWFNMHKNIPLPEIKYKKGEEQSLPEHEKMLLGILKENRIFENENIDSFEYWKREAIGLTFDEKYKHYIEDLRRQYYSFASYADSLVGDLINYLDKNKLRENTLVIFTSDHGQQYFDHGFNDKHNYYDESWRIPFIMSMPGKLPADETCDFAIWNDIPTTILAAAGASCWSMQGYDLFTPLTNGKQSPRNHAVATLYKSAAIATKRWKFEYYFEEGKGRLFDRKNDPSEYTDLYHNSAYNELRSELLQALLTWRCDLTDCGLLTMKNKVLLKKPKKKRKYVSFRAAEHTFSMKGIDSEERLNKRLQIIEEKYKNL